VIAGLEPPASLPYSQKAKSRYRLPAPCSGGSGVKLKIDQKHLLKHVQGISAVVPTKTSLPILSTFLLESKGDGKVTLTANDLDVSLSTTIECETEGAGSVAIPGKKFFEIARSLPGDTVEINADGEKIGIKCRKSRFRMVGKSAEEFPKLPEQKPIASFQIKTETMEDMVTKTSYAVSNDLTRPSLCGVLWEIKAGNLNMVATDGHRLAKVELDHAVPEVSANEFIVSPKALNILRSLAADKEELGVSLAENHITFDLGDSVVYSRLLEGPFPDYNQVIPKKNEKRLVINRDELTDACRRVAILSSVVTHQVKLVLGKDKLTISVNTPDVGEAVEEVPCSFAEAQMEIGYNARYLLDILKTMDSEDVQFLLDRNDNAGMVVPEGGDGKIRHQCLLMPLRLTD
jgi:DNA polymerase-3 subunit beta